MGWQFIAIKIRLEIGTTNCLELVICEVKGAGGLHENSLKIYLTVTIVLDKRERYVAAVFNPMENVVPSHCQVIHYHWSMAKDSTNFFGDPNQNSGSGRSNFLTNDNFCREQYFPWDKKQLIDITPDPLYQKQL